MQYTIDLPETFTFRRAGHDMTITLDYTADVVRQAVLAGLVSTIGDAASAAASGCYENSKKEGMPDWKGMTATERKDWTTANALNVAAYGLVLMQKRDDALREHGWEARASAGAGLGEFETAVARVVMAKMTFAKGTKMPEKEKQAMARFEELSSDQKVRVEGLARAAIERERAEKEALASLDF